MQDATTCGICRSRLLDSLVRREVSRSSTVARLRIPSRSLPISFVFCLERKSARATFVLFGESHCDGRTFHCRELLRRKRALSDALSSNTKALPISKITKIGLIGFHDALESATLLSKWIAIVNGLNCAEAYPHFANY